MATLAARITLLAQAVRDKLNAMTPRLLPSGGVAGQMLVKTSGANYDVSWGRRVMVLSGTTDANGLQTVTFSPAFTNVPYVEGQVYQASNASDLRPIWVQILDLTTSGCKVKTFRSKTTGVLLGGTVNGAEVVASTAYVLRASGI